MSDTDYEYYVEYRFRITDEYNVTTSQWTKIDDPQWSNWRDASGYNKEGSTYSKLSAVKTVITGHKKSIGRYRNTKFDLEFRIFRRPVPTPPPWEEFNV